jgi:hypothetical protein
MAVEGRSLTRTAHHRAPAEMVPVPTTAPAHAAPAPPLSATTLSHAAVRDVFSSVTVTFVENSTGALVVTLMLRLFAAPSPADAAAASGNHTNPCTAGHATVVVAASGDSVIAFVFAAPAFHTHARPHASTQATNVSVSVADDADAAAPPASHMPVKLTGNEMKSAAP